MGQWFHLGGGTEPEGENEFLAIFSDALHDLQPPSRFQVFSDFDDERKIEEYVRANRAKFSVTRSEVFDSSEMFAAWSPDVIKFIWREEFNSDARFHRGVVSGPYFSMCLEALDKYIEELREGRRTAY